MYRIIMMLLVCGVLISCSSNRAYRKEGPVPFKVQKPYTINGERYEPLSRHEGFSQTGLASWYGSDFHGKETSNGDTYDMHAMTAAHKTLPFGVYVKVSNRDNGRDTVVRINDRGPFVAGRIIDLSFSAAKDLGIVANGTAQVKIVALGYLDETVKDKTVYRAPESYDRGSFGIQVGSFVNRDNAVRMADSIKKRSGVSSIRESVVNGTRYFRVRSGNYSSLKEAEKIREHSGDTMIAGGIVVALE
ncbi:MAG TPA: septal ring lytic transglycosylase RlpA family protein [Desulfuromonadales bacterium]|nr:septal ring lytic transglycosylase RlpA family protein [Desulfuromonadales bacterium]